MKPNVLPMLEEPHGLGRLPGWLAAVIVVGLIAVMVVLMVHAARPVAARTPRPDDA